METAARITGRRGRCRGRLAEGRAGKSIPCLAESSEMGRRAARAGKSIPRCDVAPPLVVVWKTRFGVMGVVENDAGLVEVRVGEPTVESLRESLLARYTGARIGSGSSVTELLDQYCNGRVVSFSDVALVERPMGDFHRRVLIACRQIEYGVTISYGELASRAGRPGAARAVGTAMAHNPWPIVVPCHRVLRSGGALGGYSAPAGLALKQALLDLEARQLIANRPAAAGR